MTPAEAAQLLAMAAAYDGRMRLTSPDEIAIQAQAWAAAPDERITFDQGRELVIDHYASKPRSHHARQHQPGVVAQARRDHGNHIDPLPKADPDDVAAYQQIRANRAAHCYDPERYAQTFDPDDRSIDPKVGAAMKKAIESLTLEEVRMSLPTLTATGNLTAEPELRFTPAASQ